MRRTAHSTVTRKSLRGTLLEEKAPTMQCAFHLQRPKRRRHPTRAASCWSSTPLHPAFYSRDTVPPRGRTTGREDPHRAEGGEHRRSARGSAGGGGRSGGRQHGSRRGAAGCGPEHAPLVAGSRTAQKRAGSRTAQERAAGGGAGRRVGRCRSRGRGGRHRGAASAGAACGGSSAASLNEKRRPEAPPRPDGDLVLRALGGVDLAALSFDPDLVVTFTT